MCLHQPPQSYGQVQVAPRYNICVGEETNVVRRQFTALYLPLDQFAAPQERAHRSAPIVLPASSERFGRRLLTY